MRYSVLIILACLLLILPVTGFTAPHIQTVFQCSNDPYGNSGYGAIVFESTPPGAWVVINGIPRGVTPWSETYWANGGDFKLPVSFTFPHGSAYYDYNASFMTCANKFTYVKVTLVPITTTVPTTAALIRAEIPFAQATTTITTAVPTTTVSIEPGITTQGTQQASAPVGAGSATQPDTLGSLSVTTSPPGAFIFIDGVQRGVSPATIPGLSAGTHTVLLKLDGYQDMSTPVTIAAGKVQEYTTAIAKNTGAAETPADSANATNATKTGLAPGFEFAAALTAMGAIVVIRKRSKE
jgi:hypothetical protein